MPVGGRAVGKTGYTSGLSGSGKESFRLFRPLFFIFCLACVSLQADHTMTSTRKFIIYQYSWQHLLPS